jgi:gamma-glutamyl:cysteine ligase YbdK (ATP-grasp superfamily)
MTVPSSYTEANLKSLMVAELGNVGAVLGWTTATAQIQEAVYDALIAYGVSAIADATDANKLRAVAKREAWRAAVNGLVTLVTFSVDGESVNRSDYLKNAREALELAEVVAASYGVSDVSVSVSSVIVAGNPYDYSSLDAAAEAGS